MHHIVILDGHTANPGDLDWTVFTTVAKLTVYDRTFPHLVYERAKNATILVVNKVILDAHLIQKLTNLECICVSATGFNNVDTMAARAKGIPVCNVVGYGTDSVAQHVFALILELTNHVNLHDQAVREGIWNNSADFTFWQKPLLQLSGKTMGIYGLGKIGNKVADISLAFGMTIIAHHKHPKRDARSGITFVDLKEIFTQSDILSLHAPLTENNKGIINKNTLSLMKSTAILINTGRGGLVNESDLKEALEQGIIAAAAVDVLAVEPPKNGNILIDVPNCIITPHLAWASQTARRQLIHIVGENIKAFIAGKPQNVVN